MSKAGSRLLLACVTGICISAAPASADAASAIGVSNNQPLAFGRFAAGTGGSVTVSPSGARNGSGGAVLISSSAGTAARFTVSGDPNVAYSITVPDNNTVVLSGPSGQSMALSNFTSTPSGQGQLSGTGTQSVAVGATLSVSSQQAPGSYSGTFTLNVDYN